MRSSSVRHHRRPHVRRAFTLAELLVAGLVASIVLGSIASTLGQLARVKDSGRIRFNAYSRADAALSELRRDVISIMRSDDLFFSRFLLLDHTVHTPRGEVDRDELLVFATRLRPIREIERYNGEGLEYETQYRIEEDDYGPMLWQRRDMMPDEFPEAGGIATPLVEGIIGLEIEAFDGDVWMEEWDSDIIGMPHAVRITIYASGHRGPDDVFERDPVVLRTIVPIDRVPPPRDIYEEEEMALRELEPTETGEDGTEIPGAISGPDGGPPNLSDIPVNGDNINPNDIPGGPSGDGGGRGGRGGDDAPRGTGGPAGTSGGSDAPTLSGSQGGGGS